MIVSTHNNEELKLLVVRYGESFVAAEGQTALLDFARQHKQAPEHFILDTRDVRSAGFADSDRAKMAHTDRHLSVVNSGNACQMNLAAITPADTEHPMNQRFQRMLSVVNTTMHRNDSNRAAIVHKMGRRLRGRWIAKVGQTALLRQ